MQVIKNQVLADMLGVSLEELNNMSNEQIRPLFYQLVKNNQLLVEEVSND